MQTSVSKVQTIVASQLAMRMLQLSILLALIVASSEAFAQYNGSFIDIRPVAGLEGLNSAGSEISDDGLTLSFSWFTGGTYSLYEATRESTLDPFGRPVRIYELNSAGAENLGQTVSEDGLTAYFSSGAAGGTTSSLWVAERASREETWSRPQELEIDSDAIRTASPTLSDDGLTMYYQANHGGRDELFQVTRASVDESFANPEPLSELNSRSSHRFAPTVSSDELAIIFSATGSGVSTMIATRSSKDEPFGDPIDLDDFGLGSELNSAFQFSAIPVVSPSWPADGSKLYFSGNPGGFQLYEATWNLYTEGDADLNDEVNFVDFLILSENFGQEGTWREGDFDGDGTVGFSDFLALSENFGGSAEASAAAVPEPTGLSIALFGLLGLIGFGKRR